MNPSESLPYLAIFPLKTARKGLALILPLLARHGVRATFFITARFAEAKADCVRAIVDGGHETAVHGLAHADDYATTANSRT